MIDSLLALCKGAETGAWPATANSGILSLGSAIEAFVHHPLAGLVLRVALPVSAASAARQKANA